MIGGIAASCFDGLEEIDIQRLLAFMNADLGKHWVLNAEYLGLLTKSEIQVVAEELGLVAHMGDKFQKLMSGKKEDLIKALLEVDGFDYHGKVPGHLQYSR
jgi:ParB family chromosome partitioning protein